MVSLHVSPDRLDHAVVALAARDVSALASDGSAHLVFSSVGVRARCWQNIGVTLVPSAPMRVQLCGPLVVAVDGRRIDALLPGRQGRMLFAYLVLQRHRNVGRDELAEALWPHDPPQTAERGLNPLISKLRRSLEPASLEGRSSLQLRLPDDAWVDVEAAEQGAHRAESRVALGQWGAAWGPALVALFVSERTFLPECTGVWIDDQRAMLAALRIRAVEAYAAAALGLGGTELPAAVRAGRQLVRLVPLRESGYQILMQALARQGNVAEGLAVYADLCRTLRDELGVSPSATTQQVHDQLLHT